MAGRRILVVDDDKIIHTVIRAALGQHGYQVHSAFDSVQAAGIARQVKPALIVLDITTPGGGGFEAFRRLQMMSTTSQIPILVYTSLAYEQAEVPGFLAELSEEFQKGVGGQVAALRDAFRDGNTQALTFAAHS